MKTPGQLAIADFTYDLPQERIALFPAQPRDASKLLIWNRGQISETVYRHFADAIPENTLLLFNDTRVVYSRLLFKKETGSTIEVFCLEPDDRYADIATGMQQKGEVYWKCLVGKSSKWREKELRLSYGSGELVASIHEKQNDCFVICFRWDHAHSFAEILSFAGAVPLPPYIKRTAEESDFEAYQTIFGKEEGSVAAPTAGLHFTDSVFESLKQKKVRTAFLTLHVGAGTFRPVKSETIADHEMHAEWLDVKKETIQAIAAQLRLGLPVAAVGTTATRTLESLFWTGAKIKNGEPVQLGGVLVEQWEPYEMPTTATATEALETLLQFLEKEKCDRLIGKTRILIAPGYSFRIVKLLATNFHQPGSTLLLLIAAFIGSDWRKLYQYALEHNFRFLSYGDGCMLIP